MNFKFGWNIDTVNPNKKKAHWRKGSVGAYPGTAHFGATPIISGTGKAKNKFCTHIHTHSIHRKKSPLKIKGKVAVGIVRFSKIFRALIYRAYRAVIFVIAQLSCYVSSSHSEQKMTETKQFAQEDECCCCNLDTTGSLIPGDKPANEGDARRRRRPADPHTLKSSG